MSELQTSPVADTPVLDVRVVIFSEDVDAVYREVCHKIAWAIYRYGDKHTLPMTAIKSFGLNLREGDLGFILGATLTNLGQNRPDTEVQINVAISQPHDVVRKVAAGIQADRCSEINNRVYFWY